MASPGASKQNVLHPADDVLSMYLSVRLTDDGPCRGLQCGQDDDMCLTLLDAFDILQQTAYHHPIMYWWFWKYKCIFIVHQSFTLKCYSSWNTSSWKTRNYDRECHPGSHYWDFEARTSAFCHVVTVHCDSIEDWVPVAFRDLHHVSNRQMSCNHLTRMTGYQLWPPGGWYNIDVISSYRNSHCGDKTIIYW